MNIGLDSLKLIQATTEELDIAFDKASAVVDIARDTFEGDIIKLQAVTDITSLIEVIKQEGFTPSLEMLYGEELEDNGIDITADASVIINKLETSIEDYRADSMEADIMMLKIIEAQKTQWRYRVDLCKSTAKELNNGASVVFSDKKYKMLPYSELIQQLPLAMGALSDLSTMVLDHKTTPEMMLAESKKLRKEYTKRGFWVEIKQKKKLVKQTFEEAGYTKDAIVSACELYVSAQTSYDKFALEATKAANKSYKNSDAGRWGKFKLYFSSSSDTHMLAAWVTILFNELVFAIDAAKLRK